MQNALRRKTQHSRRMGAPTRQKVLLRLLEPQLSHETIRLFEDLCQDARQGKITGAAVAVMRPGQDFMVDTAGAARRNPTYTRGMLRTLDDVLAQTVPSKRRRS